jgi:hypothetical protein
MVKDTRKLRLIAPLSGGIIVLALIVAALFSGQLGHAQHAAHAAAANSCTNFNPTPSNFTGVVTWLEPHTFVDDQGVAHPGYIVSGKVEQAFNGNTPCNIFRVEATVQVQSPPAPAGAKIEIAPIVRTYSIQHHNPPYPDGADAHDPAVVSGTQQTFTVGANPQFTQDSNAGPVSTGRSDVEADCEILITEPNPDGTTTTYEGGFSLHVA